MAARAIPMHDAKGLWHTRFVSMDDLRIGDAERDDALHKLGEHLAAGRLDIDEHSERSSRVISARTQGEIRVVFTDLPGPHPSFGPSQGAASGDHAGVPEKVGPAGGAPARPAGKGAALRTFAAGLAALVWCVSIVVMMTTGAGWWVILVPIAYSVVLSAWSRASGDQPPHGGHGRPPGHGNHGGRSGHGGRGRRGGEHHRGGLRHRGDRPQQIPPGESQPHE